ncbi:MAG: hypothetical protein ACRD25_10180 [Terracidiphilus sp.]
MSEPAFCKVSTTEATAAKIRETTEAAYVKAREGAEMTRRAAGQLRNRLEDGWRQMRGRVTETRARIPTLKREIREDAAYVADRARYYHDNRPLSALGAIAAAAFILGIAIGFGRR